MPALSASAYRDSVGVQMHHSFTGYAYDQEPESTLAADLRTIGVRHVRDSVCLNVEQVCAGVRTKMALLKNAFGPGAPSVDYLLGYTVEIKTHPDRATRDADILRGLTAASTPPLAGMVAGLEAVNEPDLKNQAGWQATTLADDATTGRVLAQPQFAGLRSAPRLTPAIGHPENTAALFTAGWSGIGRAEIPNFHPYPPAWGGPENGLTTPCGGGDVLSCVRGLASGGAPIATESGYTTAGGPYSQGWVSEQAQAIYLPRLLLENFSKGVARTYLYEMIDLDPSRSSVTNGFGLWHAQKVGSGFRQADPKPAALALGRLNALIGDLGAPAAAAAPLDLTLRGATGATLSNDAVRRVLLQRADGSYALALWQPKSVFSNALFAQKDIAVGDAAVEVTLPGAWDATVYRPTLSGDATAHASGTRELSVPVGPDVTLIDLRGSGAPAAPVVPPMPTTVPTPTPAPAGPTATPAATPAATPPPDLPAITLPAPAPLPVITLPAATTTVAGALADAWTRAQAAAAKAIADRAAAAAKSATKRAAKARAKARARARAKARAARAKRPRSTTAPRS